MDFLTSASSTTRRPRSGAWELEPCDLWKRPTATERLGQSQNSSGCAQTCSVVPPANLEPTTLRWKQPLSKRLQELSEGPLTCENVCTAWHRAVRDCSQSVAKVLPHIPPNRWPRPSRITAITILLRGARCADDPITPAFGSGGGVVRRSPVSFYLQRGWRIHRQLRLTCTPGGHSKPGPSSLRGRCPSWMTVSASCASSTPARCAARRNWTRAASRVMSLMAANMATATPML